jgi:alkylation response protein AidB-like acyl-CoA dehydrogenase
MSIVLAQEGHPALTSLSEDEEMFREAVREFSAAAIAPLVSEMDHNQELDAGLLDKLFELGVMGIEIPEEFGGTGSTFFTSVLVVEEISRTDPSVATIVDVQNTLVVNAFQRWATKQQLAHYLPKLAREWVGAYALSEAGSGSDAFALSCRAKQDGDDWILNGQKLWITNGSEASVFIVFATVSPEAEYKGITAFIVERDSDGLSVGKKEDKLGIRASSTTEVILEDVRVPGARVLGGIGKGYKVAIETLNEGRIGIGAQMLGLAGAALDAALQYTQERKQFGEPISSFQAVQHQLAYCATRLEASKLLVYNACRLRDAGQPFVKQAAMAKIFASEACEFITSAAVELFGGYGFSTEYPVEKYYRDAKVGKIYEGTSFMQLSTIAKIVLSE